MTKHFLFVALFAAIISPTLQPAQAGAAALTIIENGQPRAAIVVPLEVMAADKMLTHKTPAAERDAEKRRVLVRESGKDLANYLEKMSGAKIEMVPSLEANDKRIPIYIGSIAVEKFGSVKLKNPTGQAFRVVVQPAGIA